MASLDVASYLILSLPPPQNSTIRRRQIDCSDDEVTSSVLRTATKRASKWLSFQIADPTPMIGQVGGISFNKRPVLVLPPDYVLKPLHADGRGAREVAVYEAIKAASQHPARGGARASSSSVAAAPASTTSAAGGTAVAAPGGLAQASSAAGALAALERCDALAMVLAMSLQDAAVAESEHTVVASWRALRKEIELLKRLSSLTAAYYGVVSHGAAGAGSGDGDGGGETPLPPPPPPPPPREASPNDGARPSIPTPSGGVSAPTQTRITSRSYVLLSDLTASFFRPCAIDIKMGRQSFEPGATDTKRDRERAKYPQQDEMGFRIVGMRIYAPLHPEADRSGYVRFGKHFGRSLATRKSVKGALSGFFRQSADGDPSSSALRTRVISSVLQQLRLFQRWFEDNRSLAFYSSSLFLVYEGDGTQGDVVNLKMIDFGHVVRRVGGDPGYLYGLKNISVILKEILEESEVR